MTLRARFRFTWLLLALAAAAFILLSSAPAANQRGPTPSLEFLGQAIVPTGTTFEGTQVGGLSWITYDAERGRLLQPLRRPEPVQPGPLLHPAGRRLRRAPRPRRRPLRRRDDAAGAGRSAVRAAQPRPGGARADQGPASSSSPRRASRTVCIDPFVRALLARRGRSSARCPCPSAFLPNAATTRGVRQNLGFESAAVAAERPLPLHRHRERARPGRPGRRRSRAAAQRGSCATTSQNGRLDRQ